MPATLEDVAKHTGYSTATISRVVNGAEGVSTEVRSTVEKAVRDLGYIARRTRPSATDRTERLVEVILHRHSTMERIEPGPGGVKVGPVVAVEPEALVSRSWELSNDFYRGILDGILGELRQHGGKAVVQVVSDLADPTLISGLQDGIDGVLVVGEGGPGLGGFVAACQKPLVLVDILFGGGRHEQVTTDNLAGMGQAVEHLAQLGHRRVGFIGGPVGNPVAAERAAAFSFHAMRLGLDVPEGWREVAYDSIEGTSVRLGALLAHGDRPTALATFGDSSAMAALRGAQRAGLSVPRDLSVVGFGDEMLASVLTPGLTSVRVETAAIGRMAVRLILTQGDRDHDGCVVRLPTRLVVRGTTAPPPG